jgi:CHAD domain-containing protein
LRRNARVLRGSAEALYARLMRAFGRPTTKRKALREPLDDSVLAPVPEQA